MNSLTSSIGLARQTAKGSPAAHGDATWFLVTDQTAGAQPRVQQLPPEMGGGMLPRGTVKTGISGLVASRAIPRPDSIGHLLYGLCGDVTTVQQDPDTTPASGDEYYAHTFKIASDPGDVPYYTLFRGVSTDFGEQVSDVKIASLVLDMQAINYVTGEWSAAGIEPTLVPDISAWSPAPDVSAPFVSCVGEVLLEGGETPLTLPVRAATLTIANAQQVDGNFVIGQYTPLDIDVIARVVTLTYVVQVTSEVLYGKLMYDPAGGTAWDPDVFNTAAIQHLTFKSAEDQAGMTVTPVPYDLSLTAAEAHWFAEPISMRGADNILVRVSGTVVQPGAGDAITLVLKNQTAAY